jgi:hypothetical protein
MHSAEKTDLYKNYCQHVLLCFSTQTEINIKDRVHQAFLLFSHTLKAAASHIKLSSK